MSDGDALFAAVMADPTNELLRLVWADWLEDRGRPGDADRARLIRLMLAPARWREAGPLAARLCRRLAREAGHAVGGRCEVTCWVGFPDLVVVTATVTPRPPARPRYLRLEVGGGVVVSSSSSG